ncbi:beta-ketoacyl-ACP reductase [Bacillus pseudomycoides]|uniref:SDR family oxidoreductase n=1 Tax=Bacillus pseudomycoides TaxID=64104 RepID=A0AAJ2DQS5_9BACI|nr:3-oxoacyl-ACP reductase FabG [Bacillus pseudomycoides]MBD5797256.1 beta-ketoacyl-ACP reductase [Bacillus pseudomycoides]MDR4329682.1 SDR family oxidoreductase [Bacillus pseudomycoides]MED1477504.1 3-oxoacyl-ACP reductase FabG [Bacillus pseudomycoides]MED1538486.1 3-oxoacyl-ACP reductase FabG [Bacillus pseudomycoides]PEO84209.1 beta-ketoacyl-ACP reductase [Bacillus pseudomycoides]
MLKGQTFLVTGGTRGIGKATVTALIESGANVVFTYQHNKEAAEELCSTLAHKGQILAIQADVQDFSQARDTIEKVKGHFNELHGLVINAGITRDKPFYMMSEEDWDITMQTNLKGTFNYARAAIYDFIKQKYGRIVCVSSVSGMKGIPGQANYSTTKAGQIGFVKTLAKEVSKYGITVNAVAPGFIATDMWRKIPDNLKNKILEEIPLGKVGEPSEVADAICFLLGANYITGSIITVDGGLQA